VILTLLRRPKPRFFRDLPSTSRGLLVLTLILSSACHETALSGRSENEANVALRVLAAGGIEAQKVPVQQGFDVQVQSGDLLNAVTALDRAGLPRRIPPGFLETLGDSSLVPSRLEEELKLLQAITGELTQTLLTLPGVVDARVHLAPAGDAPRPSLRGSQSYPQARVRRIGTEGSFRVSKASVLLRVLEEARPAESDKGAVRALVSGALPGLEPAAVEVVIVSAAPPEA